MASTLRDAMDQESFPGDDVILDAPMLYNQTRLVKASAEDIFPWVVQLGKGRGGWYLTQRWERLLPARWRASRTILPVFQNLSVGDRVPDYGKKYDYFDVVSLDSPRSLVYRADRYGTSFSWAILLHELEVPKGSPPGTVVHLRFRGKIVSEGIKRRVIVWAGGCLDYLTTAPMLAGLAERAEKGHVN